MEIERGEADAPRHAPPDPGATTETSETTAPTSRADALEHTDYDADSGTASADSAVPADSRVLSDPERLAAEHEAYRATVRRDYAVVRDQWGEAVPELRDAWEKISEKYGYGEPEELHNQTPRVDDGGWHGAGGRRLDRPQNDEVDRGYARIREVGERVIIPGVLSVEAEDPSRRLAGFEHCFKGGDRLKEKVADEIRSTPGTTATQALELVPDAVRFTYLYGEAAYTAGTRSDVERLQAHGFVQVERRNTWTSDQYKGINARWREPESGVIFEVQFHTQASLEAKELTHKAYERIRSMTEEAPEADREVTELKEFQREVNTRIPIPPGVTEYENYRPERRNG